ncbi:MAG TPA: FlgO family outer membrane protein [Verrucomicrobiae bacterium]|nr:FlgO family outer membrane protein [Verrucomicrobiae bacterium]
MKTTTCLVAALLGLSGEMAQAEPEDIDSALSTMAGSLATDVTKQEKKKVAVLDFTDLQGTTHGELGRYVAEQLSVDLVMAKRDFSVLDRANLQKILAEHKLNSKGLIDPDTAKKLGMFAGVDALIMGTIIPKSTTIVALNAKIITTDTAEIVGAARGEFKVDTMVQQLVSNPEPKPNPGSGGDKDSSDSPGVTKTFGDLRVELKTLRIVNMNAVQLTVSLSNGNPSKSLWVGLATDVLGNPTCVATSPDGIECRSYPAGILGIVRGSAFGYGAQTGFTPASEIPAGQSIPATIKFVPPPGAPISTGTWTVQLELLQSHDHTSMGAKNHSSQTCMAQLQVGK